MLPKNNLEKKKLNKKLSLPCEYFILLRASLNPEPPVFSVQVPDMEKIALLVDYVRRTMNHLDNTDAVTLLMKGRVSWLQLNENISAHS